MGCTVGNLGRAALRRLIRINLGHTKRLYRLNAADETPTLFHLIQEIQVRNFRIPALTVAALGLMFSFGAQAQDHTPNMHRPQVTGEMSNSEIAASYKAEAADLRESAKTHRKMADHFKGRNTMGGKLNFTNTIAHCNKLASQYEAAATEAEAIVADLSK